MWHNQWNLSIVSLLTTLRSVCGLWCKLPFKLLSETIQILSLKCVSLIWTECFVLSLLMLGKKVQWPANHDLLITEFTMQSNEELAVLIICSIGIEAEDTKAWDVSVITVASFFPNHWLYCQMSFNLSFLVFKASEPKSCRDYQEIKIQEQVQKLAVGTIPRSMWVILEDDLVDCCKAGDDITVCGVVMRRWKPVFPDVMKSYHYFKISFED